jgi:hypothetical protein
VQVVNVPVKHVAVPSRVVQSTQKVLVRTGADMLQSLALALLLFVGGSLLVVASQRGRRIQA